MNGAEGEAPDDMLRAAGTLATMAREQDRWREAMEAMAQPSSLRALQDAAEQTWLDTPALRMAEQAHELVSVTGKLAEKVQPSFSEQCRRIGEAVGDMQGFARIDSFAHLRGSVENWPEPGIQGLGFEIPRSQPSLHFGIDPMPPTAGTLGVESPALEPGDSDIPVENRQGYACLFTLENALRRFMADQLAAVFGAGWEKRQVPGEIRKKWCQKQERAKVRGEQPKSLIAYGDLDDYRAIIVRNDNWQAVFVAFFGHKGFVDESFRRLHPPRHTIAHMRQLTPDELELVRVETRLLLQAIDEDSEL